MVHLEEITDEVAEKLQVSENSNSSSTPPPSQPKSANILPSKNVVDSLPENPILTKLRAAAEAGPSAAGPALSPARAWTENKSVDEVVAELKKSPLFMTDLEENDDTEALRALAYEGTPLEVASDFKERGNECFREKKWNDAKEFYTKGVLVLAAEERKRRGYDLQGRKIDPSTQEPDSEEEVAQQRAVLESLYVNRAACHLEVKNYRSCWLGGAAALKLNPANVKALYRSARALLAVDRIEEADDACARGLALDESNKALQAVARDIIARSEHVAAQRRREAERLAREERRAALLKAAIAARGIRTRSTDKPPEMEDARLRLVPDEDDPTSSLSFPTVLLYPADLETDFIKAFNEQESLADHLSYVFPLPWDQKREYTLAGVECYMDTVSGGLIKVGKKAPLLKVLSSDKVEVVDEVVRIFVLPKAKAESWVQEYKSKKAAERGG
ncbi:hypothetical protein PFICI_05174 [Pestalotiopsis fici W106-1]|uniref:Cns1/TTC4 wheel domain-containing protein n=1 Tax=Pestalotiopsis fici (strain W106-1 / CGMCC3.15140) TaxID=1229662 RepID=W3XB40_PESFW|nr:uncharacterized protein PFICI_05174 [Pestalotiopsis fici W106-1]ETS83298.1 hypothetical protein PFICI_05174 [Pestalotiopsis fici W106-1]